MASTTKKIKDFIYRYRPLPSYYGSQFKKCFKFLQESSNWSKDQLLDYKLKQLKAVVAYAEKNVPFYRDLYKKENICSEDINSFEDFSKLPVTDKISVIEQPDSFKSVNFNSFHPQKTKTSGTTGKMVVMYRSRYAEDFRNAVVWHIFHLNGYTFREKRASITNPWKFDLDAPLSEMDKLENCLIFNTYFIMARKFDKLIEELRAFKPKMIWGHPNMLGTLSEYMLTNSIPPIPVDLITIYGEKMYPHIRTMVEKAFGSKFLDYYANRENSFASWGEADSKFSEISQYCHMEVLDDNPIPDIPEAGSIITTAFHNYAFPLIRYDTQDFGIMHGYTDPEVKYPVIELVGSRGKDILLSQNGLVNVYFTYIMEKENFYNLRKYQIEQTSIDEVIIRVIMDEKYVRERDEARFLELAKRALIQPFNIKLEYVDDIPFTGAGKFRPVISDLSVDYIKSKS